MRQVDTINLELSLHNLICGRNRRNIKQIESSTNTAIYFPPLFPTVFGYSPAGAFKRSRDEIILTGDSQENILQAKKKLHDLVITTKTYVKDVVITTTKVDYILLERLDKIKKIVEHNGSYVLLPPLGNHTGMLRVQATDILNVERTVKEIMSLVSELQYTLVIKLTSTGRSVLQRLLVAHWSRSFSAPTYSSRHSRNAAGHLYQLWCRNHFREAQLPHQRKR